MVWLQSLDVALFRFCNLTLSNPWFDWLMPWLSWNRCFVPALILLAVGLACKGGARGRVCLAMLLLALALGDGIICKTLKEVVARPRPFFAIADAHVLVGKTDSGSMPSSHTANWFAAAMVTFMFYRRSWRVLFPLAALIGFARISNGVHYPSDVLAGAILGAGYGALLVLGANEFWCWAGQKWFPIWWQKMPSLLNPETKISTTAQPVISETNLALEQHWLRLGYLSVAVMLFARLAYLASGTIELSEDEAYQWRWSKHLALSYYSKPPMIALTQFLGTSLWGDTEFGVRFFAPVIAAVLGIMLLRFFAREVNARAGLCLLWLVVATPLLSVGSILMTIDPLSVLFWCAAMIAGWYAVQRDSTRWWLWTGLWLGLGFLSKYTAFFQVISFAIFFIVYPPARLQLRRPGPWLALLINALLTLPVWVWNAQHGWPTVTHLIERAGLEGKWKFTLNYLIDFSLVEFGLLNPVLFIAMIWAVVAFWRSEKRQPMQLFLFCMGTPLFFGYWLYTLRSRVLPNWIAPAILPLLCLTVIYWDERFRVGVQGVKRWFALSLLIGLPFVFFLHDTNLAHKLTGHYLPPDPDPLTRVRGWRTMAQLLQAKRAEMLTEGKPVFIIGAHYGITGEMAFYLPEARQSPRDTPLVCYQSSEKPDNQFFFLPGYAKRQGQNAIYIQPIHRHSPPGAQPERLVNEFASVTDLGRHDIEYRGRVIHTVQMFACRDLR